MSKNEGIQPSSKFCSPSSNPTFSLSYLPFSSQTLTPILSRTQSSVDQFFKSIKWPPNPSFPLRVARNSSQYPVTSNNKGIQFISSSIKVPASKFCNPSSNPPSSLSSLPFGSQTLSCTLSIAQSSVAQFFNSIKWPSSMSKFSSRSPSLLLCSTTMVVTQDGSNTMEVKEKEAPVEYANLPQKEDEERVLISEVLVKNKNGEELQRKDLEAETLTALRVCRPNSALTAREIQEDVHRVIDTGYFSSCMPVAVDTRDGIRLVFQVEPNQEFHGLVCEGATILPSKFLEDAFRGEYGKVVNIRRLDEVINSIDSWYRERGLFGMVSGVAIDSGGTIRMQVAEAEVNDISIRFHDRKTGEPTIGKTKPGTILRHMTTKKGQVYNLIQSKRDVNSVLSMGIMEDVSILPQPAGDTGKVDLVTNVVERASGGFSAGGGISSGIISSPLSGLIGSFAYSHSNLFGRNQKVNISLEKGQIDSIFRMNYTDPWIEGDDKRTSRSIMVQNSRAPGTLVHGNQPNNSNLTIDRVTAGIEFSRPLRPKWSGTTGITFQRAGARDDKGDPVIKDFYGSPLTASGKTHDNMLLAKVESVYSGDLGRTMFALSMEQGLPISPEWLHFFRVNSRARTGIALGPASVLLSLSGSHVEGKFSPHEAFPIGGTNSVRGYEEGAVGSGRSSVVGCGEISLPLFGSADGVIFADYGTDLGSGPFVPGDPAGARLKPGSGYGYGLGIRFESPLGPLRLEYAFNDRNSGRFHFGVGNRN